MVAVVFNGIGEMLHLAIAEQKVDGDRAADRR
jgi:hypothetical protein